MGNAITDSFKEGVEARNAGKPCLSPYFGINPLYGSHCAWIRGWESKDRDLRDRDSIPSKPNPTHRT